MSDNPKISEAAKFVRDVTLEPYNPVKPTFSDRVVRFISEVRNPDLSEEARRADVNATKPWFKGAWSVMALIDGHPLLALLPYAPAAIKRRMAKEQRGPAPVRQPTKVDVLVDRVANSPPRLIYILLLIGAVALLSALLGG